eukprot:gnl/Spiro4/13694_TR7295_c0_g1_i1.p1 gnl/Spiro4/13694_TR7295_c0_g1~~gnl/Spiro4/13694_TR7295_c0_g1_i1.p1  ORF type:complete len:422 (+),score=89.13 gnl/Spiro4/13694_TR7295_c0_g1_i1:1469-2734(+)
MSTNFTFQLPYIPQTVVVFGCGGTGSRLVPPIAQLMSTLQTLVSPELVLVDFDEVEEKNLARQNFAKSDIGKNKATALAARYAKAYPTLKITPITVAAGTTDYDEALQMFNLRDRLTGPAMYILAVDSAKARREILQSALAPQSGSANSSVVIDAGNEDIFGQVSFFTTGRINKSSAKDLEFIYNWYQGIIPGDITLTEFPIDELAYLNMQEGQSTKSCADLDQTLAINNLMAAQVVAYCQNFLMGKPVRSWRTNFDLFNGVSYDTLSVPEVLRRAVESKTVGREGEQFLNRIQNRMRSGSASMDVVFTDLSSSLEDEMLSETPTRYETAKMIRTSLNMGPFEPSLLFEKDFPDYYTEEFKTLWRKGFELPETSEDDRNTYQVALKIMAEMEAEVAAAAAASQAVPATMAPEEDEEEGDDD